MSSLTPNAKGRYFEDYLGDGAYIYLSPYNSVVIYTSDGYSETNTVVLEPACMRAFDRWRERMEAGRAELRKQEDGDGD